MTKDLDKKFKEKIPEISFRNGGFVVRRKTDPKVFIKIANELEDIERDRYESVSRKSKANSPA